MPPMRRLTLVALTACLLPTVLLANLSHAGEPTVDNSLQIEYDVAKSWNATTKAIANSGSSTADALVPGCEPKYWQNPPEWAGSAISADAFGDPVYISSGAGDGNRPYLDFAKFGYLKGDKLCFGIFGSDSYSLVGYFRIASDIQATLPAGIGVYSGTSSQNQLLAFAGGVAKAAFHSDTYLQNTADQSYKGTTSDVDAIIPRDKWFHIVKIHDVVAKEVRFYIDGKLCLTTPLDPGAGLFTHDDRDAFLGSIGSCDSDTSRQIKGLGFSYFAAYRGVLTPEQIKASVERLTSPASYMK